MSILNRVLEVHGFNSITGVLVVVTALLAGPANGRDSGMDIYVLDERVYANLPVAPVADQLRQLAEAAGIELVLNSDIQGETELSARGQPLARVVDRLLPDGSGYALQADTADKLVRLIVLSSGSSVSSVAPRNERQRYLARQIGKRDDGTADLMHETLSDRGLGDTQAKLIAIDQLIEINSQYATESLIAGMGDKNPEVRLATARALYSLQGDEAITLIGQIYYAGETDTFRRKVAAVVSGSSHPLAQSMMKKSAEADQAQPGE
jgi:hypothetical protein